MGLIDTHFHLDFYRDHKIWYDYINNNRQYTLCVTNSPEIFYSCKRLYPETKYIKFALGYHPKTIVHNNFNKRLFNQMLGSTRYIGEVGLDFTGKLEEHKSQQIEVFDYICRAASDNQVLNVHSKNAESDVLRVLKKNKVKRAILHWYSGDIDMLHELVDAGYYFSVNWNMLNSKKGQTVINNIPLCRILVESDGPFTRINSKKFTPIQLNIIYDQLSLQLKCDSICEVVRDNFKAILS